MQGAKAGSSFAAQTKINMKKTSLIVLGLLIFSGLFAFAKNQNGKLTVTITNIQNKGKSLYIGIYRKTDKFPDFNGEWKNLVVSPSGNSVKVVFDVPYGDYALAVSHDLNGNKTLDYNLVGYPKEPFGFSNNFRPRFSGPDFNDCKVTFSDSSKGIVINLID